MTGTNYFNLWNRLSSYARTGTHTNQINSNGVYELDIPQTLDSRNPVSISIVSGSSIDPIGTVVTGKMRNYDGETPDDITGVTLTLPTMAVGVRKFIAQSFRPRGRLCIEVASLPANAVIRVDVAQ